MHITRFLAPENIHERIKADNRFEADGNVSLWYFYPSRRIEWRNVRHLYHQAFDLNGKSTMECQLLRPSPKPDCWVTMEKSQRPISCTYWNHCSWSPIMPLKERGLRCFRPMVMVNFTIRYVLIWIDTSVKPWNGQDSLIWSGWMKQFSFRQLQECQGWNHARSGSQIWRFNLVRKPKCYPQ